MTVVNPFHASELNVSSPDPHGIRKHRVHYGERSAIVVGMVYTTPDRIGGLSKGGKKKKLCAIDSSAGSSPLICPGRVTGAPDVVPIRDATLLDSEFYFTFFFLIRFCCALPSLSLISETSRQNVLLNGSWK